MPDRKKPYEKPSESAKTAAKHKLSPSSDPYALSIESAEGPGGMQYTPFSPGYYGVDPENEMFRRLLMALLGADTSMLSGGQLPQTPEAGIQWRLDKYPDRRNEEIEEGRI